MKVISTSKGIRPEEEQSVELNEENRRIVAHYKKLGNQATATVIPGAISEVLDIFEGMLDQLPRAIKKEITRLTRYRRYGSGFKFELLVGENVFDKSNDRTEYADEIEGYLGSDDPDNAKLDQFIPNNQEVLRIQVIGPIQSLLNGYGYGRQRLEMRMKVGTVRDWMGVMEEAQQQRTEQASGSLLAGFEACGTRMKPSTGQIKI
ncbi:hypothetical protein PPACK8108_LOCUS25005 [Phakopsora pachyrhizi]|uniref:Uncharacterized protein n=1 Tax=Phakopsora pachyrhizi TaxID=170000 RepID=A0AAV0BR43_PHAPC|nr:hypothetical protein PPACK8108_LOCUS25005 [Phakopsora pachyrhizi]